MKEPIEPYKIESFRYTNDQNTKVLLEAIHEILRALEIISGQLNTLKEK